jgi:hypothetical protein
MTAFVDIERDLKTHFDSTLVDELLKTFQEAKRNFYLGGLRLNAVEGGRFCEAAFRLLEQATKGSFTPLGKQIDTQKIISAVEQAKVPDGIRIHIPPALRMVYDIRNKRDAAHLADGIDPNLQDATLVIGTLDWVLAELVRLFHGVSADEAKKIISDLVVKRVPAVQEIDGFLKVLNPKLQASDRVLVLLYERGARRATREELLSWVHPKMRKNLNRTLNQLEHDRALIYSAGNAFQITEASMREVEERKLHESRR